MTTSRLPRWILTLALCAVPALGQTAAQLKNELRTKEAAAKKDPDQLFAVGQWAAEKALAADAKRLWQAVLKIKPDHAGANEALGNALVEGKWMPAKEAEALRKKAQAAEFTAKGLVEVDGMWVEKDKADDARRGIFHFGGDVVTKDEMIALQAGKVRHPDTGEIIDAKYLEKAQNKYYPVGNDRWVDLKEANTWHSDTKRPWVVRTARGLFISTLSLARIDELKHLVDQAVGRVEPLCGARVLAPSRRPVVLVAATESEFRELGTGLGDGTDACGTFLMREEATMTLPYLGEVRPAICFNEKSWAPNYVRHCAALSYAHGVAEEVGVDFPLWFLHGLGSYASRFMTDQEGGGFGKQYLKRGSIRNLRGFFAGFEINGEMDPNDIGYNIFQAGLLLSYAVHGGDANVTGTMQDVTACLAGTGKGTFDKHLTRLQGQLMESEEKITAYLQQLIAKAR